MNFTFKALKIVLNFNNTSDLIFFYIIKSKQNIYHKLSIIVYFLVINHYLVKSYKQKNVYKILKQATDTKSFSQATTFDAFVTAWTQPTVHTSPL